MTRNQRIAHQQLTTQRELAELHSRPALTPREQAQSLAIAMLAAKAAGELDRARELALALRPLIDYLD